MKKRILLNALFVLYILLNSFAVYSETNKLKIVTANIPIFSYELQNSSDKVSKYNFGNDSKKTEQLLGSDIEIISILLKMLKIPYEIEIVENEQLLSLLESGKADMALGIQKAPTILKFAYFPKAPLRTRNYVFYGRKNDIKDSNTTMSFQEASMQNYKIGINSGFLYPKEFWRFFPFKNKSLNPKIFEFKTYYDNIVKLKQRKIDLFIADKERMNEILLKTEYNENIVQYRNILYWRDYYCAISKNSQFYKNQDLYLNFDKELLNMAKRTEIEKINHSWIQQWYSEQGH